MKHGSMSNAQAISGREDVSRFVIHLTRNDKMDFQNGSTARNNLCENHPEWNDSYRPATLPATVRGFDWIDAVDAATIPLAFDLRATRHREMVQEVGQRVSGNPRRTSPDAPWLLHMWMRRQRIVISVIATNTADGRHLRRLLKLPPSKTF
jgi:hypothetical protein